MQFALDPDLQEAKPLRKSHRARKAILALSCAIVCASALPAAAGAVVVGIGDQGTGMFSDPLFQALGVKEARLTVSWDVAVNGKRHSELANDTTWLNDAAADHVTPLISFSGNGNYIPNVAQYTKAVKAFMKKFPKVKRYTPWNEPDWVYRSISRHPLLAASFYNSLKRNCKHCTVLAGDLYLPAGPLARWIKAYRKGLHAHVDGWALHNYYDVREHNANQLKALQKLTKGPIWLDEISGVERRGHWQFKNQSAAAANNDEKYLFSLPKKYRRVSRIYHYQWQSAPTAGWDSGLIDAEGKARPAYYTLKAAI
ncbi:MAG TPA: glycosyl hydrolase [Solirubrobacteraceae bacterium]